MGDLSRVLAVVHEKKVELVGVGDDELVEAVGEKVAGLLVGAVANTGLGASALEAAAEAGVNTAGSTPGLLYILNYYCIVKNIWVSHLFLTPHR